MSFSSALGDAKRYRPADAMFDVTERQHVDVMSDGVCGLTDLVEQNTSSSEEPGMASFLNSLKAGHIEAAGRASRARKNHETEGPGGG
jgi:hypothetical protein